MANKGSAPKSLALIFAICTMVGPFAANSYQPGFLLMGAELGVSQTAVYQTLSLYLVMYALGSLFVGSISDAHGRKKILAGGLLLFSLASFVAAWAPTYEILLAARLVQGIGVSVGQVIALAMTRDLYKGRDAQELTARIAMIFSLAPAFSPIVGGWLVDAWGWRSVFTFLGILSASIAVVALLLVKETLAEKDRIAFSPVTLAHSYWRVLHNPAFVAGIFCNMFLFMGFIIFAAGSADYVLKILKMGVTDFGWYQIPLVSMSMLGAYFCRPVADRLGDQGLMKTVFTVLVIATLTGSWFNAHNDFGYPFCMTTAVIFAFGVALMRPIVTVYNMDYYPKNRGLAASVQQCLQTLSFAACAAIWVPLCSGYAWKYDLFLFGCTAGMIILWTIVMLTRERYLPKDEKSVPES